MNLSKNGYIKKIVSLVFGIAILVLYLAVLTKDLADPDLWGYLAFGRLYWEQRSFPYQDIFSYMPVKNPWIYHEWLTGVLFYRIHSDIGMSALQGLRYLMALTALGFVFSTARLRGAYIETILLCLLLSTYVFAFGYSPVRAQAFTYLFFAITLFLLEVSRTTKNMNWLILIIPLHVPWCNLHGGFIAGIGIILLYAIGETLSRRKSITYWIVMIFSSVVTLINPYGLDYWSYTFNAITMPRPEISEWLSIFAGIEQELFTGVILAFLIIVLISVILSLVYYRQDITACLVLAVTGYLGISHIRHIVFFALAFVTFVPLALTLLWEQLREKLIISRNMKFVNIVIVISVTLIFSDSVCIYYKKVILGSPISIKTTSQGKNGRIEYHFPSGAVDYIRTHNLKGNILPLFDWGEYLIWNLYPDCRVGMDGRYETIYPDTVHRAYFHFIYGREGWREFLDDYPHDMIIVQNTARIHDLLSGLNGWVEAYHKQGTSLFIKQALPSK